MSAAAKVWSSEVNAKGGDRLLGVEDHLLFGALLYLHLSEEALGRAIWPLTRDDALVARQDEARHNLRLVQVQKALLDRVSAALDAGQSAAADLAPA